MLHKYKTDKKKDSKRISQVIKEITGKQETKSNLLPRQIKVDKTITQNPQDVAKKIQQIFYYYWTKIGKKTQHWKSISRLLDIS